MHITVHTGDESEPMDCPHQFVGRCDICSAPAGEVNSEIKSGPDT